MSYLQIEKIDLPCFGYIIDSITSMVEIAKDKNIITEAILNGVVVRVAPDSDIEMVFRDQQRAQSRYIDVNYVGPYPKPLTGKEIQSDLAIQKDNERRAI